MSFSLSILDFSITLRTLARKAGFIKLLNPVRDFIAAITGGQRYEVAFDTAMFNEIRAQDVIWDVGANLGLYTKKFAACVGNQGTVCAFEPAPTCFAALQTACQDFSNIQYYPYALGEKPATLSLNMAHNPLAAAHSLVNTAPSEAKGETVTVNITSGDLLISQHNAPIPNIIKIDVEGYEEEVIQGLTHTLAHPACRAVFCEIHFAILQQRGEAHAPSRIVKKLKQHGFKIKWLDSSHMAAYRK